MLAEKQIGKKTGISWITSQNSFLISKIITLLPQYVLCTALKYYKVLSFYPILSSENPSVSLIIIHFDIREN